MRRNGARLTHFSVSQKVSQTLLLRLSAILRNVMVTGGLPITPGNCWPTTTWPEFQPSLPPGLDGVKWWSLIILDGYSRTMLAGAVAPTEASWVALTVLYSACLRYGAPEHLISDSGGAYIAEDFEAVCRRLEIAHQTIVSTQGESYKNLMETHFNTQRRLFDYQFSLTQTPAEFEQVHQLFMQTYNTTAHQGLLKDKWIPPMPFQVLGAAKGSFYTFDELARKFSRALFPRTTNPYGCVTLHSDHFYVEEGLPKTQVLRWV